MIEVASALIDQVRALADAAAPDECCGLILAPPGTEDWTLRPTANVAAEPRRRFEIDPAALIAAERAARDGGPRIVGCYHSHPDGFAIPSQTDAAMAAPDGRIWLLFGCDGVRLWRAVVQGAHHSRFEPVAYRVTAKACQSPDGGP